MSRTHLVFLSIITTFAIDSRAWSQESAVSVDPAGPSAEVEVKKKSKRPAGAPKLGFDAMVGAGFDSNVYERAEKNSGAGLGEVQVGLKLDVPVATWMGWQSKLGALGSYRQGEQQAFKTGGNAKTAVSFLLFGAKKVPGGRSISKKKQSRPSGVLTFNAVYEDIPTDVEPEPDPIDEPAELEEEFVIDPEVEEVMQDDGFDDDFEDDFEDDSDADETDDGDDVDTDGDGADDFEDFDGLSGRNFALSNPRHRINGGTKFGVELIKGTNVNLKGSVSKGIIGADEGKPNASFLSFGGGLGASQQIKMFKLGAQYNLGYRSFDEKTTRDGEPLGFLNHGVGGFVQFKPLKILKFKARYNYGVRIEDTDPSLDSLRHNVRLDGTLTLSKNLALNVQSGFGRGERFDSSDKDSSRFQSMLGLRVKI